MMLPIVARPPQPDERTNPNAPTRMPRPRVTSLQQPAGLHACANRGLHTLRMDRNAYRDDNDTGQPDAYQPDAYQPEAYQPDAYWRRRVITLGAGLTLLGLLAWAFSGGGGKPAAHKRAQASGALPAAAYSGAPTSSSAGADASASAGSAASLPFLTARPSPGASTPGNSASPSAKAARGAAAAANAAAGPANASGTNASGTNAGGTSAGPASGVEPGGGCAPGAIVLSLFTSKAAYHAGQYPVFGLYAVSTASRACSFDLSPAKLHVLVSSSGRVIWDSADCTRGQPNRQAELRRGVPVQESVSWNRSISLPGCVTVASSARPGTYQVQARDVSVASPVRTFKLAR
jgi:hypothetical protein